MNPLIEETDVVVLGGGVIGLTTAQVLAEAGTTVVVVADRFSPGTTSDVAAAIWYPYAVQPREKVLGWSAQSVQRYRAMSVDQPDIVRLVEFHELFRSEVGPPWWEAAVDSYRFLDPSELPPGYAAGYAAMVPVVESGRFLTHLRNRLQAAGVRFVQSDSPVRSVADLGVPVVINCTGLGAATLCGDPEVFAIRGQVLRARLTAGCRISYADDSDESAPTYIIPRSTDVILGGTATVGDEGTEVRDADTESILRRCSALVPDLSNAEILEIKVGLRPGRTRVRLEAEELDGIRVIHNYGHGGAGFTLAWGCAEAAANLVLGT